MRSPAQRFSALSLLLTAATASSRNVENDAGVGPLAKVSMLDASSLPTRGRYSDGQSVLLPATPVGDLCVQQEGKQLQLCSLDDDDLLASQVRSSPGSEVRFPVSLKLARARFVLHGVWTIRGRDTKSICQTGLANSGMLCLSAKQRGLLCAKTPRLTHCEVLRSTACTARLFIEHCLHAAHIPGSLHVLVVHAQS